MKIAIIGAGNVASHLAEALQPGNEIVQIVSKSGSSAEILASKINLLNQKSGDKDRAVCQHTSSFDALLPDCDLYLISVYDDAIAGIASATPDYKGIWAHTSGSVSIDCFRGKKSNYGVFYPLQTFSKGVDVDVSHVRMMIEGSTQDVAETLAAVASGFSDNVGIVDSRTREAVHVAAVFACNFANLMWMEADRLLAPEGMSVRDMLPLLQATLDKLKTMSPQQAMTGPARRGDLNIVNKHLISLPSHLKPIYALLTDKILSEYHKEG